jgi:hypothetical protein
MLQYFVNYNMKKGWYRTTQPVAGHFVIAISIPLTRASNWSSE